MVPPKQPPPSSSSAQFPGGIPRLDSLGSRQRSSGIGTRRFTPKVVARRTKQERDATAPATFPENPSVSAGTKPERGTTVARRGGRLMGRGDKFAVSSAAVGPLAAPSTEMKKSGGYQSYEINNSLIHTNIDVAAALRGRVKSETPAPQGEEDGNRIDMSQDGSVDSDLARYFPRRLERQKAHDEYDREEEEEEEEEKKEEKKGRGRDLNNKMNNEGQFNSNNNDNNSDVIEPKIKIEPGLDELATTNHSATNGPDGSLKKAIKEDSGFLADEKREFNRVQKDFESITLGINMTPNGDRQEITDSRLYHIQLPAILPQFNSEDEEVLIIDEENAELSKAEQLPAGRIGKLRLHKSGKLTMKIGNIVMDVSRGTDNNFLQDVVIYDQDQLSFYQVGQISRKIVVSVDLDKLN